MMKNIVLAITAASGAPYAECFIRKITAYPNINLAVVISDEARTVFRDEAECDIEDVMPRNGARGMAKLFSKSEPQGTGNAVVYPAEDFSMPFLSGSNAADVVVIMPCDMGTVGEIASGLTLSVVSKIADIQLKERKKLIVVPRESPYSLIHLRNMTALAESGAIIAPASPVFYHHPSGIDDIVESFVGRILEMAGIARLNEKFKKNSEI